MSTIDALDSLPLLTIEELCALDKMSPGKYHALQRQGLGPSEVRYPNSNIVRVTARARAEWHERLAALAQSDEFRLERERRREVARRGGVAAAASEKHRRHVKQRGPYKRKAAEVVA
jgi:hypothetical protein